jgi:hypothetical protein
MRIALPFVLLVAACAAQSDPMPYLNATQRACLAQVKTAVPLKPGETASLFVSKTGEFTGTVTEGGFTRYELDSGPFDACMAEAAAQQAQAGLTEIAPGVSLNAADKALWDSLTPPQRERALLFLANGATIQSSLIPEQQPLPSM